MLDNEGKSALSRRTFVGRLAAGAVVVAAAGLGRAQAATDRSALTAGPATDTGKLGVKPDSPPPQPQTPPVAVLETPSANAPVSAPPPWELLRPLVVGSTVAHGWRVAGLTGVVDGSAVLTLENERGRTHRVHLCRNNGRPQGLVYTNHLDLVVMNGGQGDLQTEEGFAQAVAQVAHVLAGNEVRRGQEPVLTTLLPHAERLEQFASAAKLR